MSPEVVEKAYWLHQQMQIDDDVRYGFLTVLQIQGFDSMDAFVDAEPALFCAVVEAMQNMVEQIPVEQLRSAGTGKEEA